MKKNLKWTHLPVTEIVRRLAERGINVCRKVVKRLLRSLGFRERRLVKSVTLAPSRDRDAQFRKISCKRTKFRRRGDPVFSLDSKRKESLGNIYRDGTVRADGPAEVLDHDLPAYHDGEVTPHGIYDLARHTAHVHTTTGSDTGQFAVESLRRYWHEHAAEHYREAEAMLLLCDCGGSNSYRSKAFKHHLGELADETGLRIVVAHYPVHCSKYNPIERRVFAHVERSFRGRTFETAADVARAASEATTSIDGEQRNGDSELPALEVTAEEIAEHFEPVRISKVKHDLSELPITNDAKLPDYNYTIDPKTNE